MKTSDEMIAVANSLILVDPDAFDSLHRLARDVARMERALDEQVAQAQDDEREAHGLRPVSESIGMLVQRAEDELKRVASQEGPWR